MPEPHPFDELERIMDRLRSPDGCPWDREQTFESLRGFLLEECHEALEALDREDLPHLRDELGDLLFQIFFLSRLAKERGAFDVRDVARGIAEKMVRRHPHVFGDEQAADSGEVLRHWERIKREERRERGADEGPASLLDGIPAGLPALMKAQRLGDKAARVGFDWERPAGVVKKLEEELDELRAAVSGGERESVREELGDLLFTAVMLARKFSVDPERALGSSNDKFRRRFARVESAVRERGLSLDTAGEEELDRLWQEAKRETDGG